MKKTMKETAQKRVVLAAGVPACGHENAPLLEREMAVFCNPCRPRKSGRWKQ